MNHIIISMGIIVFVAMLFLTHLGVVVEVSNAILAFLCGFGLVVVGVLSPHPKPKDGEDNCG